MMPLVGKVQRVLLVADLEDWVLGELARQLARRLPATVCVTSMVSHAPGFARSYRAEQRRHDLVHFLSPWDFFEWAPYTRLPCVVTLWHMIDWQPFDAHAGRIDMLLVGSRQWRERLAEHLPPGTPVDRMPYGLDTDRFRRDADARPRFLAESGLPADTTVIGFTGSAWSDEFARKGLERLWDCAEAIAARGLARFVVRLAGRGWRTELVPARLRAHVHVDGFIPSEDLPCFYSSLDLYLCPSRAEGVPYPVLESMSCEAVVLSTPVGVVPELLVNAVNGFMLEHERLVGDFLTAFDRLRGDPARCREIGAAARQGVIGRFDWQRAVDLSPCERAYAEARARFDRRPRADRARFAIGGSVGLLLRPARVRLRLGARLATLRSGGGESRR